MPPSYDHPAPLEQVILLDTWAFQVRRGYLTREGLRWVRTMLRYGGFDPGPARDQLLILVGDVLSPDPADLPGSPLAVPDDPGELIDGGDDERRDW